MFKKEKINRIWRIFLPIILVIIILLFFHPFGLNSKTAPATPNPSTSALYDDFHLLIPSLDIDTPVIADVDGTDQDAYFKALENGVAHFRGTAKPGQSSNIFIFGHSSFYWYKPGNYKKIFTNLEDIKIGDEIILWYSQKEYKYRTSEIKTVDPSEIDVLKPTSEEQVSLMTCVPPGTALRRLIVVAKRM